MFELGANPFTDLVGAVGNLEVGFVGEALHPNLGGEPVKVSVSAGHGNARSTGDDSGAWKLPLVNGVAQVAGQERRRAHVAHGRETGLKRGSSIEDAVEGVSIGRFLEPGQFVVPVCPFGEVGVAIDQARQYHKLGEVDELGPVRDAAGGRRLHGDNSARFNLDQHIFAIAITGAVKQPTRMNDRDCGGLGWRGRQARFRLDGSLGKQQGQQSSGQNHECLPVRNKVRGGGPVPVF